MFVWLPTVAGTIFAWVYISWLNDVTDRGVTVQVCYRGQPIAGVPKCS
jgi:hypothetical protein